MKIGWLNPAIESGNRGDDIIAEAVEREIVYLAAESLALLPTRRPWSHLERQEAATCEVFVVGGTNLLSSHPLRYRQWSVGPAEMRFLRHRTVLLGVGWWQYQSRPDVLARTALRWMLHPELPHSVRDAYTAHQLRRIGREVVNTSCPTLWEVPPRGRPARGFRQTVVATVTDYHPDPEQDRRLLSALESRCEKLIIWPQGTGDPDYIRELGFGRLLLEPGLETFDEALRIPDVCYVGTRLHAGIRAMQVGVPSVVVAIDNRATEIASDVGVWTVQRRDMATLEEDLGGFDRWDLRIPHAAIDDWRSTMRSVVRC